MTLRIILWIVLLLLLSAETVVCVWWSGLNYRVAPDRFNDFENYFQLFTIIRYVLLAGFFLYNCALLRRAKALAIVGIGLSVFFTTGEFIRLINKRPFDVPEPASYVFNVRQPRVDIYIYHKGGIVPAHGRFIFRQDDQPYTHLYFKACRHSYPMLKEVTTVDWKFPTDSVQFIGSPKQQGDTFFLSLRQPRGDTLNWHMNVQDFGWKWVGGLPGD